MEAGETLPIRSFVWSISNDTRQEVNKEIQEINK